MQRQSYQAKTVLEKKGSRKKTFLAFKDSLGNPLSRSPPVVDIESFQIRCPYWREEGVMEKRT